MEITFYFNYRIVIVYIHLCRITNTLCTCVSEWKPVVVGARGDDEWSGIIPSLCFPEWTSLGCSWTLLYPTQYYVLINFIEIIWLRINEFVSSSWVISSVLGQWIFRGNCQIVWLINYCSKAWSLSCWMWSKAGWQGFGGRLILIEFFILSVGTSILHCYATLPVFRITFTDRSTISLHYISMN